MYNRKIPLDEFLKQREEVLKQWNTGKDVDLEEAIQYQKSLDESKRFSNKLAQAIENKENPLTW